MSISRSNQAAAALLASAALVTLFVLLWPGASQASTVSDVRVVNTEGRALGQLRQYTDTISIKADPKADCFGQGTGGSGNRVTVEGPTAFGAVVDASRTQRGMHPVSVTDAFGFGLGICAFGSARADFSKNFWYLKVNHRESSVGGDQVRLKRGDDVLWYLIPNSSCPPPNFFCEVSDLLLRAPARARAGSPFGVRVFGFTRQGAVSPVAGATVSGGTLPAVTGPDGRAKVVASKTSILIARRGADIPSQTLKVCVRAEVRRCPRKRGHTIAGSNGDDRIKGGKGPDRIKARGGDDRIRVRGGLKDKVKCGGGTDKAIVDRRDRVKGCEKVNRPGRKGKRKGKKRR